MEHVFDSETQFCISCGIARETAVDMQVSCLEVKNNVVAVSHLIARRRNDAVVDRVFLMYLRRK